MRELFNNKGIKISIENPNPEWEMWVSLDVDNGDSRKYVSGLIFGMSNAEGEKNFKEIIKSYEANISERYSELERHIFLQTEVEQNVLQTNETNRVTEFAVARDTITEDFYGMKVTIESDNSTILIIRRENGVIEFNLVNTHEGPVAKTISKLLGAVDFRVIINKPDAKFERINKAIDILNSMIDFAGECKVEKSFGFYTVYADLADKDSCESTEIE